MDPTTSPASSSLFFTPSPDSPSFSLLLPAIDPNESEQRELQKIIKEMDAFNASHPIALVMVPEEEVRYKRNREFVKRTASVNKIRNLILLEIWERGQWRSEFNDIEEFAQQVAGLSKSQFYKCLDETKVLREFSRQNLESIAPRGRFIEELVKVPENYWVDAWSFALKVSKEDGISISRVEIALSDYCRDHGLPFGRRKPNHSSLPKATSSLKVDSLNAEVIGMTTPEEESNSHWPDHLTDQEELTIYSAVSPQIIKKLKRGFSHKKPQEVILNTIISGIPDSTITEPEQQALKKLLTLLNSKEPDTAKKLVNHALESIRGTIESSVLKYCKKNTDSKKAYHRKKKQVNQESTSEEISISVSIGHKMLDFACAQNDHSETPPEVT
jgi:hypothetical protein